MTFAEARSKVLDIILAALHQSYEGTHFQVDFVDASVKQKLNAVLLDLEANQFILIDEVLPTALDDDPHVVSLSLTALKNLWLEDDSRRAFRSPPPERFAPHRVKI